MSSYSALDSFLVKWQQRWPEWSLVEPFIAAGQRPLAQAWFALLQEFEDILCAEGDTTGQDAKLAWWAEELRSWEAQRSRHPLGRVLDPVRAPWIALADSLPDLLAARGALATAEMVRSALRGYAQAVAAAEAVIFATPLHKEAAEVVLRHTLAQRLERSAQRAVPASIAADTPGAAVAAWASQLLAGWGVRSAGPRPRRVLSVLSRLRVQGLASAKGLAPHQASVLLKAWWAARGR